MENEAIKNRTDQKLRFARIHLDELRVIPASMGRGSEFERAHHEAFLAQLFGAFGAFLIELNFYLGCGLPDESLSLGKMRDALKAQGKMSPIIRELWELSENKDSWFGIAKDMRDLSTHVAGIPLSFQVNIGAEHSNTTKLKHPKTMKEHGEDIVGQLSSWLSAMESLIAKYRKRATEDAV